MSPEGWGNAALSKSLGTAASGAQMPPDRVLRCDRYPEGVVLRVFEQTVHDHALGTEHGNAFSYSVESLTCRLHLPKISELC